MPSFSIVEDFDVAEQLDLGLFPRLILLSMHRLLFECGKEIFHRCVVPPATTKRNTFEGARHKKPLRLLA